VKKIILSIAIFCAFIYTQAQDAAKSSKLKWSLGVEPSVPVGNFHNFSGFGLGGSLQAEIKPSRIGITLNGSFIDYFGKTNKGVEYPDFKYIPVLAGLKYYMSGKSFLHGEAGPGFGTNGLGTNFWYGAGIGFNMGRSMVTEFKYTGWKQGEIAYNGSSSGGGGGGGYGGGTGGTGGTVGGATTGGGGYGGHYSTLGVKLSVAF
jgi:hypothetical protein